MKEQLPSPHEQIYKNCKPNVEKFSKQYYYPDPAIDSEDVAQDAWVTYARCKDNWSEDANPQYNMIRITKFRAIDALRISAKRKEGELHNYDEHSKEVNPEQSLLDRISREQLVEDLSKIIGSKHLELLLYHAEGLSQAEMSELTGLQKKSIDNMLTVARRKIRQVYPKGEIN